MMHRHLATKVRMASYDIELRQLVHFMVKGHLLLLQLFIAVNAMCIGGEKIQKLTVWFSFYLESSKTVFQSSSRDRTTRNKYTIHIWKCIKCRCIVLTQWGRNKMAALLQTIISNEFSWMISFVFRFKFPWSLFIRVHLTTKSVLIQVMAWRLTGDKPSLELMLTQFTDAYMRHWGGELMWLILHNTH